MLWIDISHFLTPSQRQLKILTNAMAMVSGMVLMYELNNMGSSSPNQTGLYSFWLLDFPTE